MALRRAVSAVLALLALGVPGCAPAGRPPSDVGSAPADEGRGEEPLSQDPAPSDPTRSWEEARFGHLDWFTDVAQTPHAVVVSSSGGVLGLSGGELVPLADVIATDLTKFGSRVVAVGFASDGRTSVTAVIDGSGEATVRGVSPALQRVTEVADGLVALGVGSDSGSWEVLRSDDGLEWRSWHDLAGRWFGGWLVPSRSGDAAVAVLTGTGREIHVRELTVDGVADLGVIDGVHVDLVRSTGGELYVGGRRSVGPLRGALLRSSDGREWAPVEVDESDGGQFLDVIEIDGRLLIAGALRRPDGTDVPAIWRQHADGWVREVLGTEPGAARLLLETPSGISVMGHAGTLGRGEGARVWTQADP